MENILKTLDILIQKPANYLLSKNLSADEVRTLFKLRTRIMNVKGNFETGQANLCFRTCQLFRETQQHLLEGPSLQSSDFDCGMIYGTVSNQDVSHFVTSKRAYPGYLTTSDQQRTRAQVVVCC